MQRGVLTDQEVEQLFALAWPDKHSKVANMLEMSTGLRAGEILGGLYLKGISTGDMSEALAPILGPAAAGLSPTNVVRLKTLWEQDYAKWCARDFELKRYVYFWVDGIHFNVRLDEERSCILVIMGANESGREGVAGRQRRLRGKQGLLARNSAGFETPWPEDRSEVGRRRWSVGILGGAARGLPWMSGTAMLGPQDREYSGQDAQERTGQGQGHAA